MKIKSLLTFFAVIALVAVPSFSDGVLCNNSTCPNGTYSTLSNVTNSPGMVFQGNATPVSQSPVNTTFTMPGRENISGSGTTVTYKETIKNATANGTEDLGDSSGNTHIDALPVSAVVSPATGIKTTLSPGTAPTNQYQNSLRNGMVAFIDPVAGSDEIAVIDLGSAIKSRIPHGDIPVFRSSPAVGNDRVVFVQNDDWIGHLYLYTLSTGEVSRLPAGDGTQNQFMPAMDGTMVVYVENSVLREYNLETGADISLAPDLNDTSAYSPAINGDIVAWLGDRQGVITLYAADLRAGSRVTIADDIRDFYYRHASISGDRVVWQDSRDGQFDVYLFNMTSGKTQNLTPETPQTNQLSPAIYGNRVAYIDRSVDSDRVILLDIATGNRTLISEGVVNSMDNVNIWDNRVTWDEFSGGSWEVFMFTIGAVQDPVHAAFSANSTIGMTPVTIQFTDLSTGNPESYLWEFGDGNISRDKNPVHMFTKPGIYDVTLEAATPYSRDRSGINGSITAGTGPVAGFDLRPRSGPAPLEVRFTDSSAGYPTSWKWDFGDNSGASGQNPVHTFASPGVYTVTLSAGNEFGDSRASNTVTVVNASSAIIPLLIPGQEDYNGDTGHISLNTTAPGAMYIEENDTRLLVIPADGSTVESMELKSDDGYGFSRSGPEISGNLTGLHLATRRISSPLIQNQAGAYSFVNISVEIPWYSPDYGLQVQLSGDVPDDQYEKFVQTIWNARYAGGITGIAYVARCGKINFSSTGPARITMSVGDEWLKAHSPYVAPHDRFRMRMLGNNGTYRDLTTRFLYEDGASGRYYYQVTSDEPIHTRNLMVMVWNASLDAGDAGIIAESPSTLDTVLSEPLVLSVNSGWVNNNNPNDWTRIEEPVTIIRIDDWGNGEVLPVQSALYDTLNGTYIFQADSPNGLSDFALVTVNNPGNPLQMLYLSIAGRIAPASSQPGSSSGSGSYSSRGGGGGGGGSYGGSGSASAVSTQSSKSATKEILTVPADGNNGRSLTQPEPASRVEKNTPQGSPLPAASPGNAQAPAAPAVASSQGPSVSIYTLLVEIAVMVSVTILVVFSIFTRYRKAG